MRLQDQVVLITGGSRGVGAAVARAVAREGAHVALAGKTLEPHPKLPGTLGEVAEEIRSLGQKALVIQTDIRFPEQVEPWFNEPSTLRPNRCLINNAGAIFTGTTTDFPIKRYNGHGCQHARCLSREPSRDTAYAKNGGHIVMMSPPSTQRLQWKSALHCIRVGMTMVMAIDAEERTSQRMRYGQSRVSERRPQLIWRWAQKRVAQARDPG